MSEIIPISSRTIGADFVPTVNLRELWKKLESKRQFSDWAKERLSRFKKGSDYLFHKDVKKSGRPLSDYYVSLEVAKHIALMENNDAGDIIREYFMAAERALRAMQSVTPRVIGPVEMARLYLAATLRAESSGNALEMLVPINAYGDIAANGSAKTGLRRAAFVASRHRKEAAEHFVQTIERIDEMERQMERQMELDFEEVAS